jgi:hypothetical protein
MFREGIEVPMINFVEINELHARLHQQAKKLKQLEQRLLKEQYDKAHLEDDFQHAIEQLKALQRRNSVHEEVI